MFRDRLLPPLTLAQHYFHLLLPSGRNRWCPLSSGKRVARHQPSASIRLELWLDSSLPRGTGLSSPHLDNLDSYTRWFSLTELPTVLVLMSKPGTTLLVKIPPCWVLFRMGRRGQSEQGMQRWPVVSGILRTQLLVVVGNTILVLPNSLDLSGCRNAYFPTGITIFLTQDPSILTLIRLWPLLALSPACLLVYSLEELPHLGYIYYLEQPPRPFIDGHPSLL